MARQSAGPGINDGASQLLSLDRLLPRPPVDLSWKDIDGVFLLRSFYRLVTSAVPNHINGRGSGKPSNLGATMSPDPPQRSEMSDRESALRVGDP